MSTNRDPRARWAERPLVGDAAMGTAIYARGIFINKCYDELCVTSPDLVVDIHRQHVAAGAEVLETNSFGANRFRLAAHGLESRVEEFNILAAELARRAAGDDVLVAGSMGPLGLPLEPIGRTGLDEAREAFRVQAKALAKGGADMLLLETFSSLDELRQALRGAREGAPDLPVGALATFDEKGLTPIGTRPERIAEALQEEGADLIGANCSVGPAPLLDVIEKMAQVADGPFAVYPNAGIPQVVEGRLLYLCSPDYLGKYARRFLKAAPMGLIGGCCGTTEEHVHKLKDAVLSSTPRSGRVEVSPLREKEEKNEVEPVPLAKRSRLAQGLADGRFVASVEVSAPRGTSPEKALKVARRLKAAGVDAMNIPDGPRATARMSNAALAVLAEQEVGLETILHFCCRDRNLLGMQSDLIGAHALGLRNLCCITGDPPRMGDYPMATAVFDVDAIGLVQLVSRLNKGRDAAGNAIGGQSEFLIAVGANPAAVNLDEEVRRFEYKVEAGAEACMTQPVYDVSLLERFLERTAHCRIPTLVGILPLASHRNAEFLHEEVPGMSVPKDVRDRMRAAGSGDQARQEGVAIAREALEACRPLVQGVYVMPPLGGYRASLQLLEGFLEPAEASGT
ncbi:MAG: bifunctional homocysteine S-methyltransferase/methylenetetrahydrofolate reductase [Acidobacteriota bacterium]